MDVSRVLLVIALVVVIVVGVHAALYALLRRGGLTREIKLLQKAGKRARQPWKEENAQLEQLAELTDALKDELKREA
jgi:uncharacterized protein HemX